MSEERQMSFMERREAAEREAGKAASLDDKGASFLERQEHKAAQQPTHHHEHRHETHIHHHHYGAHQKSGKEQFLEDLGRDIAKGLEETFNIR